MYRNISKHLTLRKTYIFALSIILMLAGIKYFMITDLIRSQENAAEVVNTSGRQRMLSQQIALFSLEFSTAISDKEKSSSANDLDAALSEFEANHQELILTANPKIQNLYFNSKSPLNERVEDYIQAAKNVISKVNTEESLRYILETGPDILLPQLNKVVALHENQSRSDVNHVINLQRVFMLLTFIVLVLEALFLFNPLIERIEKSIQDLKTRQDLIEAQHKELKNFTYITSHNLQEPLRKMTSFSQKVSLKLAEQPQSDIHTYVDMIVKGAAHMRDMIQGLKSYADILVITPESFENKGADSIVRSAVKNLGKTIENSGAFVRFKSLPMLYCNPELMTTVFEHLISNAIKYKSDRPLYIDIECAKKGGMLNFTVKDNGQGIPQAQQDRIFVMFQRLHRKEEIEGIGIGLTISQKIIELHGGKIWVESKSGEGSQFYFTVPDLA